MPAAALMGVRTPLSTSWALQKAPPARTQPPTATAQAIFSPFSASSPSLGQPKIQLRSWDAATAHQLSPSRVRQLCRVLGLSIAQLMSHVPSLSPTAPTRPCQHATMCSCGTELPRELRCWCGWFLSPILLHSQEPVWGCHPSVPQPPSSSRTPACNGEPRDAGMQQENPCVLK